MFGPTETNNIDSENPSFFKENFKTEFNSTSDFMMYLTTSKVTPFNWIRNNAYYTGLKNKIFNIDISPRNGFTIISCDFIFKALDEMGIRYFRVSTLKYHVFNEYNVLVGLIDISVVRSSFSIDADLPPYIIDKIIEKGIALNQLIFKHGDASGEAIEIYELEGWNDDGEAIFAVKEVQSKETNPALYPNLDYNITDLFNEFMDSDENVLVLYGAPGTGKTSFINSFAATCDIQLITANRSDVLVNPKLFETVFNKADEEAVEYIKSLKTDGIENSLIFDENVGAEFTRGVEEFAYLSAAKKHAVKSTREAGGDKRPVVVIEDADLLIGKREDGNQLMHKILNDTCGLSSNRYRKIIFTTNKNNISSIDSALIRDGRCYGCIDFGLMNFEQANKARASIGLNELSDIPENTSRKYTLAEALVKNKVIKKLQEKARIGF